MNSSQELSDVSPSNQNKMLELSELNVYYGESHILRNVDLNISSGERSEGAHV